jgi:transcriptional regulator with XRE-family HTH domain
LGFGLEDDSMTRVSERNAAIGKRIAEIREDRGLTQAALAAAIGVSKYMVFHFEHGQTRIAVEHLELIAAALQCRINDFRAPPGSPFRKQRLRGRNGNEL